MTDLALSARGVHMEYRDRSADSTLVAIETMDLDVAAMENGYGRPALKDFGARHG